MLYQVGQTVPFVAVTSTRDFATFFHNNVDVINLVCTASQEYMTENAVFASRLERKVINTFTEADSTSRRWYGRTQGNQFGTFMEYIVRLDVSELDEEYIIRTVANEQPVSRIDALRFIEMLSLNGPEWTASIEAIVSSVEMATGRKVVIKPRPFQRSVGNVAKAREFLDILRSKAPVSDKEPDDLREWSRQSGVKLPEDFPDFAYYHPDLEVVHLPRHVDVNLED